jgi:putative Holliday junction resolvase
MRYLGLDIGARRIGVAVGSTEVRLATPLTVVERRALKADAARLAQLAHEYDVEALVVGLPQELDQSIGAQAKAVVADAEKLGELIGLPLEFFDERYSTASALSQRREIGVSEKRGRATIDAAAAAVILQDYLNAQRG